MLLRLPSPPLSSSYLSTTTPIHLRLFSSSSSPRPRPRRRRSLFRCAAGNDLVEVDAFTNKSGYLFELSNSDANSIEDYDISKIGAIYRRRPLILLRRLFQTGLTFGKWFAFRYIDNLMERSDQMFEVRAAELRQVLLELGPAYIKIAQAISSRPDLIPPSYLDELSLLQDRISPFSTEVAINTIEQELGLPIEELFSEISLEPVAAASLGQVYQARLRRTGQVVAVKVQRPGVQAAISLDILILRSLAGLLRRIRKLNTDLQAVVDEWASSLFREMDYRTEANNGLKFRKLYGGIPDVLVPEMYLDYTTRRVLVMEWVEGQKLSEVNDLYMVEVGTYCSFNQLLEYGFYHADPHPGNLLRTYDGKLAYLDFGMMGEFKQELRNGFIEACLHLVNRDFGALAKDFVTLGLIPPTADKEAVTKALTGVFQNAVAKGVRNISFGDLLGDLGTTMYKFKFRIPSYFSLVIRSLAVLEGVAIGTNPDYKVLGSTYPWIARKVLTDSSPELKSSLHALLYEEGIFKIDRLESLLSEALRARTEKALLRKQEDERVVIKQILSFMLAEKGAFVRDILLQEFAKGLDALGLATLDSITTLATASIPFTSTFSFSTMTNEDKINLRTLHRLLLLLSGLQGIENSKAVIKEDIPYNNQQMNLEEASLVFNQLASIQDILPILSVISELPPESQQQLLNLPADLTGRLISRAAARTIRRIIL
ncbi:PREDICTED: aarF domain-containing kinase [Prunus dulcis]|uniref:PREDICTED: aarF domain-containing kinase n=2 Tax=Prunus dulcis TaxID=3755 RepID=A0A5E4G0J6_PRUDU|nr:PREDICTED: aarF domain-containing kinase [Prunus dulcis]VVA41346.1 PREDICTED: aarF domain-containing kinase [Prunus dulcis]